MKTDINKYLIDSSTLLVEALKVLNQTGKRIIFLIKDHTLDGSLTYGDVSRWILNGNSLNLPSYEAATRHPITISPSEVDIAYRVFSEKNVDALPVVDNDGNIVDIIFKEEERRQYTQIHLPVVIMAGGKGTRLYPYTKILPKPLIPIGEIPISEHIIDRFCKNGCKEFYFIVNYKKNMIKAYYNEVVRSYDVSFIDEDKPLGTGGGLSLMKGLINSTFILTNCDSFIDEDYADILKLHNGQKNYVTMICSDSKYQVPYGVIEIDKNGSLTSMCEKPSFNFLTNTGIYIVEPQVIDMINPGEFIGFPDIIQRVKDAGHNVGVYTVSEKSWLDMGQFDSMEKMKRRLYIED